MKSRSGVDGRLLRRRATGIVAAVIVSVTTYGCSHDDGRTMRPPSGDQFDTIVTTTFAQYETVPTAAPPDPNAFLVTGPWQNDTRIANRYTCSGANVSPPLAFDNLPDGTVSLAVVLAPAAEPTRYLWVIANVDPDGAYIDEGSVPAGAAVALNDDGIADYSGPCPESGTPTAYVLTAFAVAQMLEIEPGDPGPYVVQMLRETAIDIATTTFTFTG